MDRRGGHDRAAARQARRQPHRAPLRDLGGQRHREPLRDGERPPLPRPGERGAGRIRADPAEPGAGRELSRRRDRRRAGGAAARRAPGDAGAGGRVAQLRPQEPRPLGGPGVRRLGRRARPGLRRGRRGDGRGVGRAAPDAGRGAPLPRGDRRRVLPLDVRLPHRGRRGGVQHGANPAVPATGLGRVGRRALLRRDLAALPLARRMGWCQAARYIVPDAAGGDERGRRRAAADHGARGDPHHGVRAGGRAAHRVRARRRARPRAECAGGLAAGGGPAARQLGFPTLRDAGRRAGDAGRRRRLGMGARGGVLPVGRRGPGARRSGLSDDCNHVLPGDQR